MRSRSVVDCSTSATGHGSIIAVIEPPVGSARYQALRGDRVDDSQLPQRTLPDLPRDDFRLLSYSRLVRGLVQA